MTTEIPIPAGPTVKEILDLAFGAMGTSDVMFGRTENEYEEAAQSLNAMMAEWPFDQTGYIFEDAAGLRIEEEGGIARSNMTAVAYTLAERLASSLGKSLSPEARKTKNRAYSRLCASVSTIPEAKHAPGTARGSGHRYAASVFFPAES